MAVTFSGTQVGDELFNSVDLVSRKINGTEVLPQTVAFLQGTSTSGQAIQGDICLFGGDKPLITSPTVASNGTITANNKSYGFGISATRLGSMSNAKGICDNSYVSYATAVITDSSGAEVGINITVPFDKYTLAGIGYVQAPVDIKIHYIYIDSSHGTETPTNYYNSGNCIYITVNKSYTTRTFTLLTDTGTYQHDIGTAYHYFGDVIFRLSLPRSEYISWKNGDYKPPVHLNSNASIVRN